MREIVIKRWRYGKEIFEEYCNFINTLREEKGKKPINRIIAFFTFLFFLLAVGILIFSLKMTFKQIEKSRNRKPMSHAHRISYGIFLAVMNLIVLLILIWIFTSIE